MSGSGVGAGSGVYGGLTSRQVGSLIHPGYVAGRWYGQEYGFSSANYAVSANVLYASPFRVAAMVPVDRLAMRISTGAVGLARMGIYRNGPSLVAPGALVAEGNTDIDTTATPTNAEQPFAASVILTPGWWWAAVCFSATPSVSSFNAAAIGAGGLLFVTGAANSREVLTANTAPLARVSRVAPLTFVAGSPFFPASFGASQVAESNIGSPLISWRAA